MVERGNLREFRLAIEGVGVEPPDQGMRLVAGDQRAKQILPTQEAVGEEVEAGVALDPEPTIEICRKRGVHGAFVGAAAVESARRFYNLLGPRIKAMLIGKNLDRHSLSIIARTIG